MDIERTRYHKNKKKEDCHLFLGVKKIGASPLFVLVLNESMEKAIIGSFSDDMSRPRLLLFICVIFTSLTCFADQNPTEQNVPHSKATIEIGFYGADSKVKIDLAAPPLSSYRARGKYTKKNNAKNAKC